MIAEKPKLFFFFLSTQHAGGSAVTQLGVRLPVYSLWGHFV